MSKFQLGDKVQLLDIMARLDRFTKVKCPTPYVGVIESILTGRVKDIKQEYMILCLCEHRHFGYAGFDDIEYLGWSDFLERIKERMS